MVQFFVEQVFGTVVASQIFGSVVVVQVFGSVVVQFFEVEVA